MACMSTAEFDGYLNRPSRTSFHTCPTIATNVLFNLQNWMLLHFWIRNLYDV